MSSIPDSCHVGLPLAQSPSEMAYSSGPSSVVSTRETSPASSTHHFVTTTSPSPFRPEESSSSMDQYSNFYYPKGDRAAEVSSSNLQQVGGPWSPNHLCADKVMTNASPPPFVGGQSTQLSSSYFFHSAAYPPSGMSGNTSLAVDESRAYIPASPAGSNRTPQVSPNSFHCNASHKSPGNPHNLQATSLVADEVTKSVLSPSSIVNHHRMMVMPSNSNKPSQTPPRASHQHSASLAGSHAVNKSSTTDASLSILVNSQTRDMPNNLRSASHSPCRMSIPQSAHLVSSEDAASDFVSIVNDRTVKISSGSFQEANDSPTQVPRVTGVTGIASHARTDNTETTKSEHPLTSHPSRPHSSTQISCGPQTSNWQSSTTSFGSLASPSTTACSSTGVTSLSPLQNNPHTCFAKTTNHLTEDNRANNKTTDSNTTRSSPISTVHFSASNAFPKHYASIANPSRVHTRAISDFRNDADQPSQSTGAFSYDDEKPARPTTTFRNDGDRAIQTTSASRHNLNHTPQPTDASSRHNVDRPFQPTSAFRRDYDQSSHFPSKSSSTTNIGNMQPTSGLVIAKSDLDRAMAYCYDRGDGTFTRLVPVDLLPIALEDIPARVASDEGMIVLPILHKAGPDGQPANGQLSPQTMTTPPTSPAGATGASTDLIQSRIDRIINSTPTTSGPVVLARSAGSRPVASKREKIYCDKWIHDGTCAFTQQGCKFKHEMPVDKETQMSLGLFHGFPPWWRRYCAERSTQLEDNPVPGNGSNGAASPPGYSGASRHGSAAPVDSASSGAALKAISWRRPIEPPPAEATPSTPSTSSSSIGGANVSRFVRGRGGHGRTVARYSQQPANFGPIAPPSKSEAAVDTTKRKAVGSANTTAAVSSQDGTVSRGRFAPRRGGGAPLNLGQYEALEDLGESDVEAEKVDNPDDAGHGLI